MLANKTRIFNNIKISLLHIFPNKFSTTKANSYNNILKILEQGKELNDNNESIKKENKIIMKTNKVERINNLNKVTKKEIKDDNKVTNKEIKEDNKSTKMEINNEIKIIKNEIKDENKSTKIEMKK